MTRWSPNRATRARHLPRPKGEPNQAINRADQHADIKLETNERAEAGDQRFSESKSGREEADGNRQRAGDRKGDRLSRRNVDTESGYCQAESQCADDKPSGFNCEDREPQSNRASVGCSFSEKLQRCDPSYQATDDRYDSQPRRSLNSNG